MGECVCKELIFCKSCYSKIYYKQNKDKVLDYQKTRYKEVKKKKHIFSVKTGSFTLSFD